MCNNSHISSFRSSARFFSFLGTTFSGRWERPPPTYDEAMKHVNPDLAPPRPQDPPPYSEPGNRRQRRASVHGSMVDTPPPEYRSQEGLNRIHLTQADSVIEDDSTRRHHHHHHHRRHHSRHTGPQTPKTTNADQSATEALLDEGTATEAICPVPGHEGCNPQTPIQVIVCSYNLC